MILKSWAERLACASCAPETIDLHVMDTVTACFAAATTGEGHALSALYGRNADAAEQAAGVSAIARLSECDDIHLPSCVTPGAVVIPVALALAGNCSDGDFTRAVSAGYVAGLSLGVGIGGAKALSYGVWPTLLAAPLMAAVTASCLAGYDSDRLAHAMALALSGASGRLGRPIGTPSGRWFALAEVVAKGVRASHAAGQGFRGDLELVSEPWLAVQAGHTGVDIAVFESASAPSMSDVGFKPFPIARQGANAVAALERLLSKGLVPEEIKTIEVFVPGMNVALLNRPALKDDRLSRISNIGYQLACAALAPEMLYDVERQVRPDVPIMEFATCVSVTHAPDLDVHLPGHWAARVVVNMGGSRLEETVTHAPFDHDAPGLAQLLSEKWRRLLPSKTMRDFDNAVNVSATKRRTVLWQTVQEHVSMAARSKRKPEPARG